MSNFLTTEERTALHSQHKKERDGRVRDRIKAVLLRDKGWTWMQIAEALLLSEEILRQHLKEFQASKKLKPENGGSNEKLSSQQSKELCDPPPEAYLPLCKGYCGLCEVRVGYFI